MEHTVATLGENGRHAVGLRLRLLEECLAAVRRLLLEDEECRLWQSRGRESARRWHPTCAGCGEVDPTFAAELDPSTDQLIDLVLELERTRVGPTDATTIPSA